MDVPAEDRGLLNLHPVLCSDLSRDLTANNNRSCLNSRLDAGALANHQRIGGKDLAPKRPADPNRPKEAQLSLKLTAGLDDAGDCRVLYA